MEKNLFQHLRRTIAAIACVGGIFFAHQFGKLLFGWQPPNLDPNDAISLPTIAPAEKFHLLPDFDWPTPEEEIQVVDLFSPPIVELEKGKTVKKLGRENLPKVHFQLTRLEELPYHLQLDGFVEEADGTLRLLIRDGRTGIVHALREGESIEEGGPTILRQEWEAPGRTLRVILEDAEEKVERCLRMGTRTMTGQYRVEIRTEVNGITTVHPLSAVSQSFPVPGGDCVLQAIHPERKTVSLQPPNSSVVEVGFTDGR